MHSYAAKYRGVPSKTDAMSGTILNHKPGKQYADYNTDLLVVIVRV